MWRNGSHVMVELEPTIGGSVVGKRFNVGTMTLDGNGNWYATDVQFLWHDSYGPWHRYGEGGVFCTSASTPNALKEFVRLYDEFFIRTLLEYEGEVFNPITNETRIHYGSFISYDNPLQDTWIRISDDENALARVWNDEFKKLAGAIVPVHRWHNADDHAKRPQRNIWAVIHRAATITLGMPNGVKLPPHLWTIIDPDTEKDIPIIDPADEDVAIEKEYRELVERNEAIDRMNAAHEERSADPAPQRFLMGKTYTNWPHANTTCRVIAVSDEEIRVEVENSNGNIVRRWATVQERPHMNTVCISVDVEPFNIHCYNACDIVEVDA